MNAAIRNTRDLWAGLLYLVVGGLGLYIGSGYRMGTAAAMGPGYFPAMLSGLLVIFGGASVVRAFLGEGESVSSPAWKAGLIVLASMAAFALLLERAGLIIALAALMLISATASSHFRFALRPLLGLVGLVAFCALVFVYWLGVPMPLFGIWSGG